MFASLMRSPMYMYFLVSVIEAKPNPNKLRKKIYCATEDQEYTTGVVLTM